MNTPTGFSITTAPRRTFVLRHGEEEVVGTFPTKRAAVARAREYLSEADDDAIFAVIQSDARADSQAIFEDFRYMLVAA